MTSHECARFVAMQHLDSAAVVGGSKSLLVTRIINCWWATERSSQPPQPFPASATTPRFSLGSACCFGKWIHTRTVLLDSNLGLSAQFTSPCEFLTCSLVSFCLFWLYSCINKKVKSWTKCRVVLPPWHSWRWWIIKLNKFINSKSIIHKGPPFLYGATNKMFPLGYHTSFRFGH